MSVPRLAALRASSHTLEFWGNESPKCPHCSADYDIDDNEAWHLYSDEGGDVTCPACNLDFTVSTRTAYTFNTDEQDDDENEATP